MKLPLSSPRLRRPIAWLAIWSLLAGLLLPSLAHALADERSVVWTEVCTAQGMKRVPMADEATAPEAGAGMSLNGAMDHCPWCLLSPAAAVAPPPAERALPLLALGQPVPPRFLSAPRTPHAWCTAQPRGPPAVQG